MIEIEYSTEQEDAIYAIISECFTTKQKKEIENFLRENGISVAFEKFIRYNFKEILDANEILKAKLSNIYPCTKYTNKNGKIKKNEKCVTDEKCFNLIYKAYDMIANCKFIQATRITVCPYCNRNYINNRGDKQGSQIDHFLPRSKYPIFAACIYNLVPSCSTCNLLKGVKRLEISPFSKCFDFDNEIQFSYYLVNIDYLSNVDGIRIMINTHSDSSSAIEKNFEILKIREAYEVHNQDIVTILKKQQIYTESYIDNLMDDFNLLLNDRAEFVRLIYDVPREKNFLVEPISKLKNDILKEIGVI